MKKVTVTLRDSPNASVEVPEEFPRRKRARGTKAKAKKIERSAFGAIRLFPGIPKAISVDELEYVKIHRSDVFKRLESRAYVESKRIDYRGKTEAEIEALAAGEGLSHLPTPRQIARLVERKKLVIPDPKKSTTTRIEKGKSEKVEGGGKTTARKPK